MSERIFEGIVFVLGGCAYGLLEILFRGYTHWTMVITGGACILTMYHIQGVLMDLPLIAAATAGAPIVTAYEFTVGLIVNVKLGWGIWDYSSIPFNILGQICPIYTMVWFLLCLIFIGTIKLLT